MAEQAEHIVERKEHQPISNRHLAITEHAFIGSSVPYDGNKFFTTDTLIEAYEKEGKIPDIFLRPLSLNEGFSSETVKQERSRKFITGMIGCFGESGADLYFDGLVTVIVLPVPDDDGQVQPIWKVILTDVNTGKRVENEEALKKLKLEEALLKVFDQKIENNEITLTVKTPEQTLQK